ncbi:hypothetical protein D3C72_2526110 [compost metagenome]
MAESILGMAIAVLVNANPSGVTAALGLVIFLAVLVFQVLLRRLKPHAPLRLTP